MTVMVLGSLLAACNAVKGSGNVVSREIPVTAFSRMEVSNAFQVHVAFGSAETVTVRVDDNLVDLLDVGVDGETLHVGLEPNTGTTSATLEADVTVTTLDALSVSGAATVTVADAIASHDLAVTVSGASRLFASLGIERGGLELSGASHVELSGSAAALEVTVSGASDLEAADLSVVDLTIDLSGASHAAVTVTTSLSAGASGASNLTYSGSPQITRSDTSGASSIQPAS
jgi:hypothetical protein